MTERKMERKIEGRKYVVVGEDTSFDKGEVLTLLADDGSNMPLFKTEDSSCFGFVSMDKVLLLAEDEDESESKPELETGKIYFSNQPAKYSWDWVVQVKTVVGDEVKYLTALGAPDFRCPDGFYCTNGSLNLACADWVEATPEQQIELLQAKVKHGDATESDLELLSELMPLDNPELIVGEVYVCNDGRIFRFEEVETYWENAYFVTGNQLNPSGEFFTVNGISLSSHRKALPHEVAKLEEAEKEHGCVYQKPLVNELGTVIEEGKYYKSVGHYWTVIYKVDSVNTDLKVYTRGHKELNLTTGEFGRAEFSVEINSPYGNTAVPATPEEIEQFKKAEAREKLPKFEVGKSYTVWHSTFDCSVITVTRVDYCCDRVTFKYKGKFGSYVSETQKISSEMMANVTEVK